MGYRINKERAKIVNNDPSATDQAGAQETDINIIVKRMGIGGTLPGNSKQPMYGDFTQLPDNLRDCIELARSAKARMAELPEKLRNMPIEDLLALQPAELTSILKPEEPPKPAEPAKEPTK